MSLLDLPNELIEYISEFLDDGGKINTGLTCIRLNQQISVDRVKHRVLLRRNFKSIHQISDALGLRFIDDGYYIKKVIDRYIGYIIVGHNVTGFYGRITAPITLETNKIIYTKGVYYIIDSIGEFIPPYGFDFESRAVWYNEWYEAINPNVKFIINARAKKL